MKTIDHLNASEAVSLYQSIGLHDHAEQILANNQNVDLATIDWPWNSAPRAWEHSNYAYGFISAVASGSDSLVIKDARNIEADASLKNARLTVSLDYLNVFDYPGHGVHQVLFKFNAKNQFDTQSEDVTFNQTFPIQEGENAPIAGYPIFIGLGTGDQLVQFNVEIVNVTNDNDEKFLKTLNSGVVTSGMKLVGTINPIVPIVTEYAKGITEMIASRNKNVTIPSPKMGLYFDTIPGRMKLCQGMYVAIQNPSDQFEWSKWVYNRDAGRIQSADGSSLKLPYNYFCFSISKHS